MATSLGKEDVVSEILNLEIQDSAVREEYLSEAFCSAIVSGHSKRDMALLLLQAGANVNRKIKDSRTPLIRSIECSEVSMARLLVRHGARADISDANGNLPLTLAASKGYHLLVRDMVRSGKPLMRRTVVDPQRFVSQRRVDIRTLSKCFSMAPPINI